MRPLTRRGVVGAATVLVVALATAAPAIADDGSGGHHGHSHSRTLLHADLVGSLTTDEDLFGVAPGGADWSVSRSTADVRTNGRADIKVRDLVLTGTGANPVATISASLACNGSVVSTLLPPVAFDTDGDARIKGTFKVPARCLAPAVLLHPVDRVGTFIAASGAAR
jgi:hypothetical protein